MCIKVVDRGHILCLQSYYSPLLHPTTQFYIIILLDWSMHHASVSLKPCNFSPTLYMTYHYRDTIYFTYTDVHGVSRVWHGNCQIARWQFYHQQVTNLHTCTIDGPFRHCLCHLPWGLIPPTEQIMSCLFNALSSMTGLHPIMTCSIIGPLLWASCSLA